MDEGSRLAQQFEENRGHLRGVAYRMLGSLSEADDAVQEAWLRLSRSDAAQIENLSAWLTTVVARICLDMLRSRTARAEDSLEEDALEMKQPAITNKPSMRDPEQEAMLADSVGVALLVVLDRLSPAERLAFVLHDVFAMPFEEIAAIIDKTPDAARQLASRARKRVQGNESEANGDAAERLSRGRSEQRLEQRRVVDAFLKALRSGDMEGIVAVLDPDVRVHIDAASARPGAPREIQGARNWAQGAVAFSQMARLAEAALVDGQVGVVFAPEGKLFRVLRFKMAGGKIAECDIIGEPARLSEMELGVL